MLLEYDNHKYELLFGSDTISDGVYLEMNDINDGIPSNTETVLFAFRSSADNRFTFQCFRQELPLALVEIFIQEARKNLLASK